MNSQLTMGVLIVLASSAACADDSSSVTLSPAQIRQRDIQVTAATRMTSAAVTAPGTVEFDADRVALVGPRLASKVVSVTRDLGAHVAAGDLLALLDSVDIGKAKARRISLRAEYEIARAASVRENELAAQQISSEAERLQAQARLKNAEAELRANAEELRLYGLTPKQIDETGRVARERLSTYPLYSPIAGTIEIRDLKPGESISADSTPIEVVDTDRMWVVVDASEQDVSRVATGSRVRFVAKALPGRTFEGQINWVSGALDPTTRTLRLRTSVDNKDHVLKAGMYGDAQIDVEGTPDTVWVSAGSVQTLRGIRVVFCEGPSPGRFQAVTVETGREQQGQVEITHGIAEGQRVVTSGAYALTSMLSASNHGKDAD